MRWVIAPLIAAIVFLGSAWLNALERTTEQSVALAENSRSAPAETQRATEEVASLPTIAQLTQQQADAFRSLVDALALSAERVKALNGTLEEQAQSLDTLRTSLDAFQEPMSCVEGRLTQLVAQSERIPPSLADVRRTIAILSSHQDKSIRHLKSINRKMTALGLVATATDVEPPPPPGDAPAPDPGGPRPGQPC
jgi:chromosome segregation ATPase